MESKEVSAMLFSCNEDEVVVSGLSAKEKRNGQRYLRIA